MFTRIPVLAILAAAAICGSDGVAQAGLIVPQCGEHESMHLAGDDYRAGAPGRQHDRTRVLWCDDLPGLLAIPTMPVPSGGMGAQSVGASVGFGAVLPSVLAHQTQPTMVAWGLLTEQMLSLPPPLAGRFFRPPRA